MLAQRAVEVGAGFGLRETLEIARRERPDLTTPQPQPVQPETVEPPVSTPVSR
jgi:hypothetical protein